ncbi:4-hydroxy-tetrahydrodipicolinate synthase [Porticoccus sp. W117]|uniref:4-hydroxy-tetrahydrodipicolinate synthase n=1 Tax=Porticoccus sp. W117 TaxID=3054777 RepID=UPI0025962478|nr:4-hydroxy-tetrahydrodipicolinate synthase [Porticoccus sp. W117]MDM3872230.1 4-hydroxy-tetrahydrodipicolinate synthase [Porticoccus sp. W117]
MKRQQTLITGSIVALVTPLLPTSNDVDWDGLKRLVDWHIEAGTDAIVAVGTSGESSTLSMDEHKQVIKAVVDHSAGRIPIIAGTGANSTHEALELTSQAKEAGADACLLVTPYYNKPTQEGLFQHFKTIADSVDIPQILYNVPGRTACDLLPETVLRLAEVENIVGIKEATGDLDRARQLIDSCPQGFAIYSGDDMTAAELILMGGHGDISVTANVAPELMAQLCRVALEGDAEQARTLNARLDALHNAMFVESNPIPVKWALLEMGRIPAGIRLPLTVLSAEQQPVVRAELQKLGLV